MRLLEAKQETRGSWHDLRQEYTILGGAAVLIILWSFWFYTGNPPAVVNWIVLIGVLFFAGYHVWRADHLRLEKKLVAKGDLSHSWPLSGGHTGTQYYFEVLNMSEGLPIHDIRVRLTSITPASENIKLPVFLHQQHDQPSQYENHAKSFGLNPQEGKNVDLITWASLFNSFNISHISGVGEMDKSVQVLQGRILKVEVTASDSAKIDVYFSVTLNESGVIQCREIPNPSLKNSTQ